MLVAHGDVQLFAFADPFGARVAEEGEEICDHFVEFGWVDG